MATGSTHKLPPAMDHPLPYPVNLTIRLSTTGTLDKYPAKPHARRVAEHLSVPKGLILLSATPSALYPNSDQPVPFRQDRYFYYLSGCNEPRCYLTYDIGEDVLVLWLPAIDERKVVWLGRGSTVEEAREKYDVDEARYITSKHDLGRGVVECEAGLEGYVRGYLSRDSGRRLYTLLNEPRDDWTKQYMVQAQDTGPILQYALNTSRTLKDPHEISLIRQANTITAAAHHAVLSNLHRFTNEAQVEAEYTFVCIARHAKNQAYSPIAGSGPNASILHYTANDASFGDSQVMVLDAGCEVSCYASDVTRSFPLHPSHPGYWPSKEAESVYKLVESVQEACIAEMKPGKSFAEISRLAFDMTLDGLLELGILRGEREAIKKVGTHFAFFPHGLGHHLGLEVHDVAPRAPPRGKVGPMARWRGEGGRLRPEYTHVHSVDGKAWIAFPFRREGWSGAREYTIRCDVADTAFAKHDEVFKAGNRVYDVVAGEKLDDELVNKNLIAVALAKLNPVLRGEKDVLSAAVECYWHLSDREDDEVDECERCGKVGEEKPEMPPLPPCFDFTTPSHFYTRPPPVNRVERKEVGGGHDYSILEPGMVVTVEPGLYFNSFLLNTFFLDNPTHAPFIDREVLERFMPVGGVRIEDDILITRDGYENLTSAVKGEEMLEVIREGARVGAER
ncbi:hypothetical protein LTS02_013534 [Friedmanniomyces endolithicus]|nr:hypothetical protein LTS02_013534 [Friedmanniomyces endolithicus]